VRGVHAGLHLLDESQPLRELFRIREIPLEAKNLSKFVGSYRLSDDEILETTLEADQLFVQITGDDRYPVFPYQDNAFFYKVADARLIFEMGENGRAEAVVLEVEGHGRTARKTS